MYILIFFYVDLLLSSPSLSSLSPVVHNHLDSSLPSNHRPVSNLPFLSRSLEKLVFKELNIFEQYQSGAGQGLRSNMDLKELSVLALLDPTAAFDTGDHSVHTFWFASMVLVLTGFSLAE